MTKQNKRWLKFLGKHEPTENSLPLLHTTRAYSFDEIIEGDELKPRTCDVFNEPLTYLYYGRPAYRARSSVSARLEFDWPIAFVVDPTKIEKFERVFPFDSGAFAYGVYKEFFDSGSQLDDFQSGKTLEDAKTIVSAYYKNNREYYTGGTRQNVDIGLREFEAGGVFELARLPGAPSLDEHGRRDERSSTIELQTNKEINLRKCLLAIVVPNPYLGDEEVMDAIERWNVPNVRTYQTLENTSSDVWVGQIYQIVFEILEEMGFFDDQGAAQ